MSRCIGILGCGWLGTPLATSLLERGYEIRGTTTKEEKCYALEELGVQAFHIYLSQTGVRGPVESFLKGLNCLIVNIPPGLMNQPDADFVSRIRHLENAASHAGIPRVFFVSSTSVFGSGQGIVTEAITPDPETNSGQQMLQAEALLLSNTSRQTVVLRLGGLLGPDRHPVLHLSGKEFSFGGNLSVNLIRLGDALGALQHLVADQEASGVYHGVYPEHPPRRDYYASEARFFGIPPPVFKDKPGATTGKRVHPERLLKKGFQFYHSIFSGS